MRGNKGLIQTVEALLAVAIIIAAVAFLFQQHTSQDVRDFSGKGYAALEYLDSTGELAVYAYANNSSLLKSRLNEILDTGFEVSICQECSLPVVPSGADVSVIKYYIAGYKDSYSPMKIILYTWDEV